MSWGMGWFANQVPFGHPLPYDYVRNTTSLRVSVPVPVLAVVPLINRSSSTQHL